MEDQVGVVVTVLVLIALVVLVVGLSRYSASRQRCPHCGKSVSRDASVCPYCQRPIGEAG